MAANKLPAVIARIVRKLGKRATLSWPTRSLVDASGTGTISTYTRLVTRNVKVGETLQTRTVAILPMTERDIVGATLTVDGKTYKVVDVIQHGVGDENALQEAVLA